MTHDPMRITREHVNRIMQGPPTRGIIRDALAAIGLVVLFVAVVYISYGFGVGEL